MARKKIQDMIQELRSWLPNYDHKDYPTTLFRILASLPGGEELEDMGYEPMPGISWQEADQLGRVLEAIEDKGDVEDLVAGLIHEEEEVEESRRSAHGGMKSSRRGGVAPDATHHGVCIYVLSDQSGRGGWVARYGNPVPGKRLGDQLTDVPGNFRTVDDAIAAAKRAIDGKVTTAVREHTHHTKRGTR